jgi:hypothetical protein
MVKLAKAPHSDCGDCVGSNPTPGTTGVSVNWQTSRLQIGDCGFESCYPCQVHAESWPSGLRRRTANAERITPSQVRILYSPPSSEGAAEWTASGPENRGSMMSRGGSIPPPSAKFAREVRYGLLRWSVTPVVRRTVGVRIPPRAPSSSVLLDKLCYDVIDSMTQIQTIAVKCNRRMKRVIRAPGEVSV